MGYFGVLWQISTAGCSCGTGVSLSDVTQHPNVAIQAWLSRRFSNIQQTADVFRLFCVNALTRATINVYSTHWVCRNAFRATSSASVCHLCLIFVQVRVVGVHLVEVESKPYLALVQEAAPGGDLGWQIEDCDFHTGRRGSASMVRTLPHSQCVFECEF